MPMYFENAPEADLRDQNGDLDHFRRLINFANHEEQDWVWDRDDVTDAEAHEYCIYLVGRIRGLDRVARCTVTERNGNIAQSMNRSLR